MLAEETKVQTPEVGYMMCIAPWSLRVLFCSVCFVFSSFGPRWRWLCGNARLRQVRSLRALAAEFECRTPEIPAGLMRLMMQIRKDHRARILTASPDINLDDSETCLEISFLTRASGILILLK